MPSGSKERVWETSEPPEPKDLSSSLGREGWRRRV